MTSESSNKPNLAIYSKKKGIKLVKGEGLLMWYRLIGKVWRYSQELPV